MSTAGVLDFQVVTGAVTGEVFEQFVQHSILPHLMPFNGTNQHCIVVMDNASIHHVDGITDIIQGVGAIPVSSTIYTLLILTQLRNCFQNSRLQLRPTSFKMYN